MRWNYAVLTGVGGATLLYSFCCHAISKLRAALIHRHGIIVLSGSNQDGAYYKEVKGTAASRLRSTLIKRGFTATIFAPRAYIEYITLAGHPNEHTFPFDGKKDLLRLLSEAIAHGPANNGWVLIARQWLDWLLGIRTEMFVHVFGHGAYFDKAVHQANQQVVNQGIDESMVHSLQFERYKNSKFKSGYFSAASLAAECARRERYDLPLPTPPQHAATVWDDAVADDLDMVPPFRRDQITARMNGKDCPAVDAKREDSEWILKCFDKNPGVYITSDDICHACAAARADRALLIFDCCYSAGLCRQFAERHVEEDGLRLKSESVIMPLVPEVWFASSATPRNPAAGEITFATIESLDAGKYGADLQEAIRSSHLFSEEAVANDVRSQAGEVTQGKDVGDPFTDPPPAPSCLARLPTSMVPHFALWPLRTNSSGQTPFMMFHVH